MLDVFVIIPDHCLSFNFEGTRSFVGKLAIPVRSFLKHYETFIFPLPFQRFLLKLMQTTVLNIFYCFSEKIRLDFSCEPSAWHIKHQALFSSKHRS